jgi:glycosyltransferase involved in cell wall biosynthesis
MFSFIAWLFVRAGSIVTKEPLDVVIASSTYPLDIYPAWWIARKHKARLIFEVHDLWPLSPIELAGMSPQHPFILGLQWAEEFAYRHADRVVSLLPNADGYMREHGMAAEKFTYIPNGVDVAEWTDDELPIPKEHLSTIESLKKSGKVVVAYAGAHGLANSLRTVLEAARLLKDMPVSILFVGQGPEKPGLQLMAQSWGLSNVEFLPPVPRRSIPKLLASVDILYIGLRREPLFRFGISPNKLFDYMMAGKPIIQAIDASNDIVSESGCGITIPPEDPQLLADAVKQLMSMSSSVWDLMGVRGKEYVLKHHDYRTLASEFLRIMK